MKQNAPSPNSTAVLAHPDTPGVRVPPPLIAALILLFGLWINAENHWSFFGPKWIPVSIGLVLAGLCLILVFWCFKLYTEHRTSILPHTPDATLIIKGPFSFTRNPIYLALCGFYLAGSLIFDAPFALALFPLLVLALHFYVIRKEEHYLYRRFGEPYAAYIRQTPRWMFIK